MASRSWFSIVKKKLLTRKKAPQGKKMMIIHNNTSITSQDEDNRISCVEVSNSNININSIEEVEKMADVISDDMTTAPSVDDDSAEEGRMIGAAVRIQSFFRGHLARRAFRALRSLVKLQAVVRGVCVRKQAWIALRCVHALVRLQDRLRSRHLLSHHPTMHIHSA